MGVATDHVIESWRNDAWPAYKSSAGVPPDLLGQFPLFEEALASMGLVVWAMTDLEADDALASAAAVVPDDPRAHQVVICTPDKDLGQCVRGEKVVCLDRRKNAIVNEEAVRARFGVGPSRSPTGWRWWATAPTGSRACRAGAQGGVGRPRPLRHPRSHPARRLRLGGASAAQPGGVTGCLAGTRPGRRPTVQEAGHMRGRPGSPPHRRRRGRQPGLARPGARVCRHVPEAGSPGIAEAGRGPGFGPGGARPLRGAQLHLR